jgi:hypothetical protein
MQKQIIENLTKLPTETEQTTESTKETVEVETVKLAKVKTGVMAGICCIHDDAT